VHGITPHLTGPYGAPGSLKKKKSAPAKKKMAWSLGGCFGGGSSGKKKSQKMIHAAGRLEGQC